MLEARQEPLANTKTPQPTTEEEQLQVCKDLVQWCLSALPLPQQLDMASKIEVRPSDNPNEGNAVYAVRDFKPGELVLSVPRALNISVTTAVQSQLVRLVARSYPPVLKTPVVLLALQLCAEAMLGEQSKYKHYIAILPSVFSIPLFYTPATLKNLT